MKHCEGCQYFEIPSLCLFSYISIMICYILGTVEGNIEEAIKQGFLALDEKMRNDDEMRDDMSGTTAVVVLIKNKKIYCG